MSEPTRYFEDATEEPSEAGRFVHVDADLSPIPLAPGLTSRPLAGRSLLGSFVRYEPHSEAPRHAHEEEQLFVVLEGALELELGDEVRVLRPGDAALIPAWVPHAARSLDEPAYQLDVFSPPRRALLALMGGA